MTAREKEKFCKLIAAMFSPPEREMSEHIQTGRIHSFLRQYLPAWGSDETLLAGFKAVADPEVYFAEWEREYDRLFSGVGREKASLIESCYKPWTQDPGCQLSFAHGQRLLMGDSALHMTALFQHAGIEVPESSKACPDHLVLEMEFLSALYGRATDREIRQFIIDHLDWIPGLKKELIRFLAQPFYISAIEVLDLFLNRERKRLEIEDHGEKSIP